MSLRASPDPLDDVARRWVERSAGRGWRVVGARRLTGGISTATHEVTLERGDGRRQRLVLRRPKRRWLEHDAGATALEAGTLAHVASSGLPVPEVVAVEPDLPRPALLMRKLPGRIDLDPADPDRWVAQQAEALAAIHALPPVPGRDGEGDDNSWKLEPRTPPPWSAHPHLWERAIAAVAAGERDATRSFVHGDFQHFNLLWTRGRLTGIVDWGAGTWNHPDTDTGHCRLNLVILYGSAVAEDFLRRYEVASGRTVDPWWDLVETVEFLPSWADTIRQQVRGRIPLDVDAMHRRVDAHLPVLLDRL